MAIIHEEVTETAKKVRQALREAFPDLPAKHFSVKSTKNTKGGSIGVYWEDYPSEEAVKGIISKFASMKFDPQTNTFVSEGYVHTDGIRYMGAGQITTHKGYSPAFTQDLKKVLVYLHVMEDVPGIFDADGMILRETVDAYSTPFYEGKYRGLFEGGILENNHVLGDMFGRKLIQLIEGEWYCDHPTKSFLYNLMRSVAERDIFNHLPQEHLRHLRRYIVTHYIAHRWVHEQVMNDRQLEHPITDEALAQFACGPNALPRAVESYAEGLQLLGGALEHSFRDYFSVKPSEAEREQAERERLAKVEQVHSERMDKLEQTIAKYHQKGFNFYGQFREINGVRSFVINKGTSIYIVNAHGIFKKVGNQQSNLVRRKEGEGFECFQNTLSHFLPIMDFMQAGALSDAIREAFVE